MLERLYVEIGNICNLSCSFCPGTKRQGRQMTVEEFGTVLKNVRGRVRFLYLHVMGEPLLHPQLSDILGAAGEAGLPVCITTNGTLLKTGGGVITGRADTVHKVSISLHAPEGNGIVNTEKYVSDCAEFAAEAAAAGIYTVFRLWNEDSAFAQGKNSENANIEKMLRRLFPEEWQKRPKGYRLAERIFLEYDGTFVWPVSSGEEECERLFCHALSSQAAVLADGTVVPCCLDSEGLIPLGNIFEADLDEILRSERARKIKEGFSHGKAEDALCKKCSYARRFKVRNN